MMARRRSPHHEREHDDSADDRSGHQSDRHDSTALDHATHTGVGFDAPRTVPHRLGWFRPFYVACIIALSAVSLHEARGAHDHHAWLAGAEILGALLLLASRTRRAGLVLLLLVYGVATALTVLGGQLPIHLMLYAGTAIFLVQFRSDRPNTRGLATARRSPGTAQA